MHATATSQPRDFSSVASRTTCVSAPPNVRVVISIKTRPGGVEKFDSVVTACLLSQQLLLRIAPFGRLDFPASSLVRRGSPFSCRSRSKIELSSSIPPRLRPFVVALRGRERVQFDGMFNGLRRRSFNSNAQIGC